MATVIKAIYEDGVFKPEGPVSLEEKTHVEIVVQTPVPVDEDDPTGWKTARELIGCITEELEGDDIAVNHDRYLYRRDP